MNIKICPKCKIEKPNSLFGRDKSRSDNLTRTCKSCISEYKELNHEKITKYQSNYRKDNNDRLVCYHKNRYQNNKEAVAIYSREYRKKNKEKISKRKHEYYVSNAERLLNYQKSVYQNNKHQKCAYSRNYYHKNKAYISIRSSAYYKKNRAKIIELQRKRKINRRKTNEMYALECRIRNTIRLSIKNSGYTKKSKTYEILGCDYNFFKSYIESKFSDGMDWSNKGEWELDHIIPTASAQTEDDILRLNHYTNLQPLWAADNRAKSDNMPPIHIQEEVNSNYLKAKAS